MSHPCGQIAQLVEQRTENPRVGGSIPPLATINPLIYNKFLSGIINTANRTSFM